MRRNISKLTPVITLLLVALQTSCVMAGGYGSRGGWFFWPGGLGILVILAVLFLLMRRRR